MSSPRPRTANRRPIPILVYHQIDAAPPAGAPYRSLYVAPSAFARQMALLRLMGWQGLSMTALEPYLRGEKDGKVVGITFDDGYVNNLDHALPALLRNGFSATCYFVSGLMGQTNRWDAEVGIAQVPLMTGEQARAWAVGGQEGGAHTRHHVHLPRVDDAAAREEVAGSRADLEAELGTPVRHFCYPYGDYEPRHAQMAAEAGFASVTTTRRGRCHAGADWLALPRVPVLRSTTLAQFWLKIATAYEDGKG